MAYVTREGFVRETGVGSHFSQARVMVPETFGNKVEDWTNWQEEVEEYMDSQALACRDLDSNKVWAVWRSGGGPHPCVQGIEETTGEARKVVGAVRDEDGFQALRTLRMRFGPSVTTKQGIILAEFSGMARKPATSPGELDAMMTEMAKKIWMIEKMIPCQDGNSPISSLLKKSVLAGIVNPMTRHHTATHHGESFEELLKVVLGFANNAVAHNGPSSMQIGSCQDHQHEEKRGAAADWFGVWAGKWQRQRMDARMASLKGKFKGPKGGCFICGGHHYAANCSTGRGNGKGHGKPSVRILEENVWGDAWSQPEFPWLGGQS